MLFWRQSHLPDITHTSYTNPDIMAAVLKPYHPHIFLIGYGDMGSRVAHDLIDTKVTQPPRTRLQRTERKTAIPHKSAHTIHLMPRSHSSPASSPCACGWWSAASISSTCVPTPRFSKGKTGFEMNRAIRCLACASRTTSRTPPMLTWCRSHRLVVRR